MESCSTMYFIWNPIKVRRASVVIKDPKERVGCYPSCEVYVGKTPSSSKEVHWANRE